jgi:hypothetical protein
MSTSNSKVQTQVRPPLQAKPAQSFQAGGSDLTGLAVELGLATQLADIPAYTNNRSLRQNAVSQMQKHSGNTAVQAQINHAQMSRLVSPRLHADSGHIARDEDEDVNKGLDASMLAVNMSTPPASGGKVSVQKTGDGPGGMVKLTAPHIAYTAGVSLANGVKLGSENGAIKVGPVQTLVSSVRTGVYQKGNSVVAEMSQNLSNLRDARPLRYADDTSKSTFTAESPFYDKHGVITDMAPAHTVNFEDQPKFALPVEFGGGRLVAVNGADEFNTSVGAKRENVGTITMNPFGWKVDWSLNLAEDYSIKKDKDGNPIASEIAIWEETRGLVIDSETYAREVAGSTPYIFTFKTLEAAMTESAASLWAALLPARQHDPAAAKNIEEALRQKNPSFNVKLTVAETATWGSDTIGVFANAGKQSATRGPFALNKGESETISFKLTEIMDPGNVTSASQLSVWAGGHGDEAILGEFLELPHPFTGSGSIAVTDSDGDVGHYSIEVKMA